MTSGLVPAVAPAPWRLDELGVTIVAADGSIIATLPWKDPLRFSNGKLIAAAPKLAVALERLLPMLTDTVMSRLTTQDIVARTREAFEALRAAGRAP